MKCFLVQKLMKIKRYSDTIVKNKIYYVHICYVNSEKNANITRY